VKRNSELAQLRQGVDQRSLMTLTALADQAG
jgi:hypothetical protein